MKALHTTKEKWFLNNTFIFATQKITVKKWKQQGKFRNAF